MAALEKEPVRKIKVCCFCERWESGGIESFLCNVLLHMDMEAIQVDIVAAQLAESVFTEPLKTCGVEFFQLSGKLRSPANERAFSELLKKRNYDVVYLNIFQGMSLCYGYLAKKAGVSMRIAHSHGTGLRSSPGKALKMCLHRLGKQMWSTSITDFWACSRDAAIFLFPKGQMYQWLPNGIAVERFRFQPVFREIERRALGLAEDTLLVGTVGRLSAEKNHAFLLKIFCEIKRMRENSTLLIVGTGCLQDQLQRKARALGLGASVIFYGASTQVERLLWAMDLFVFPSYMEGFGIAGVEAQAAGLPVLCSKTIPPEAIVTKQAVQMEISAGAKAWAERALELRAANRCVGAEAVAAAGFDVQAVADRIWEKWVGDRVE